MRWMKVDHACAYAGGLSRKQLYSAAASGELKVVHYGKGRNILFAAEWLDDYLRSLADREPAARGPKP